jgi:hypothetical protein
MLPAGVRTYAGLFVVTLATLTEEILLTRIFSVTISYSTGESCSIFSWASPFGERG